MERLANGSMRRNAKSEYTSSVLLTKGVPVSNNFRSAFTCFTAWNNLLLLFRIVCCYYQMNKIKLKNGYKTLFWFNSIKCSDKLKKQRHKTTRFYVLTVLNTYRFVQNNSMKNDIKDGFSFHFFFDGDNRIPINTERQTIIS